ncbi:MAG: hypothetical protein ACKVX7_03620 [Planctomycetota bacterium]
MTNSPRPSGITIPGYQPIEKLANPPSYGVWVRALQTRMERRVLLKLVPAEAEAHQVAFGREIAAMVKLDGNGVLRVIDEGLVAGVRYLVTDEAGTSAIATDAKLTSDEWLRLAQLIESLARRLMQEGMLLVAVPAEAVRRDPAGNFVLSELGWLVPLESSLPSHPHVPESMRGRAAQPWMCANLVGMSIARLGEHLRDVPPAALLKVVAQLQSCTADDSGRAFAGQDAWFVAPAAARRGRKALAVSTLVVALLVIGGVAYLTHNFLTANSHDESPVAVNGGNPVVSPPVENQDNPPPKATNDTEAVAAAAVERERLGWQQIEEAVGESGPAAVIAQLKAGGILSAGQLEALQPLLASPEPSAARSIASLLVELTYQDLRAKMWTAWRGSSRSMDTALAAFAYGPAAETLSQARRMLDPGEEKLLSRLGELRRVDWESWSLLRGIGGSRGVELDSLSSPAWLEVAAQAGTRLAEAERALGRLSPPAGVSPLAEFTRYEKTVVEGGRAARAALEKRVAELRREFNFNGALQEIEIHEESLLAADKIVIDELSQAIRKERSEYERLRNTLTSTIEQALLTVPKGDWQAAEDTLRAATPGPEYPSLHQRGLAWQGWLKGARAIAKRVAKSLNSDERRNKVYSYKLKVSEGEPQTLRGKVESVEGEKSFMLDLDGVKDNREIAFSDLELADVQALAEAGGEGIAAGVDALLMIGLLGDLERALRLAPQEALTPGWLPEIQKLAKDAKDRAIQALVNEGRQAFDAKQWEAARATAIRIHESFARVDVDPLRVELLKWHRQFFEEQGPPAAFASESAAEWKDWTDGMLGLSYEFRNPLAIQDWNQMPPESAANLIEEKSGSLHVKGVAALAPDGRTDIFTGQLEVEALVQVVEADAPNLNFVIWARQPRKSRSGVIGGIGCKPPEKSRLMRGANSILLPATVLGDLLKLDEGIGDGLLVLENADTTKNPKVTRTQKLVIKLSDDGTTTQLVRKSAGSFRKAGGVVIGSGPASAYTEKHEGTVEIRTYGKSVFIGQIYVRGRVRPEWWNGWVENQLAPWR